MRTIATVLLVTALGFAQTFEVASIKPSNAEPGDSGSKTDKGMLRMRNVTLRRCIRSAYGITEAQIYGGPKWLAENRYDIDAKAAGPAGDPEFSVMLQALLGERFMLTVHRETRTLSGYGLTVGKAGLKARRSVPDAESRTRSGNRTIEAEACTMAELTRKLSDVLKLPVADLTETKASFDFKLEWSPDEMKAKPAELPSGPSIFSALQEQLGLKLESRKVPAEVLVIDRAELPSEN